jgi:4-hydroxybenzoate polyprenyltransferase
MTLLQFGIGALNDAVDAPLDAGRKPGKPIPLGLVSASTARTLALMAWIAGVALAALSGWATAVVAMVVIAIGLAYDLRFKGTAWSWLPFAVGIPILPVFGWLGASGSLPVEFAVLLPAGVAGGIALAIGNALIDVERDQAAGITSVAAALGKGRAQRVTVGLLIGIGLAAVGSAAAFGVAVPGLAALAACSAVAPASTVWAGPDDPPSRREAAWVAQAIGMAVLGVGWLVFVLG